MAWTDAARRAAAMTRKMHGGKTHKIGLAQVKAVLRVAKVSKGKTNSVAMSGTGASGKRGGVITTREQLGFKK